MTTTHFNVPDIECEGCANAIKNSLSKVTGISSVNVDVNDKRVTVEHPTSLSADEIAGTLTKAGFAPQDAQ